MAKIEIQNLTKRYELVDVFDGLNCAMEDGEFTVILGPSGCGKSTLLRMIAGLEEVSGGQILKNDKAIEHLAPKDRGCAMVFQNYALYPHMTVCENISYGLKLTKMPKAERMKRVEEVAETLSLTGLLDRKPNELSGGQRQRVAIGRAIARRPDVFLFDEPLSNLDAKLRMNMRLELKKLQRDIGTTSIYVTHDQVEAMTLADRIIIMNQGKVEQIGSPAEIYNQPASTFVASFIGAPPTNLIKAKIASDASAVLLSHEELYYLEQPFPREMADKDVLLGIRPEDLFPVSDGNGFDATVELIEDLGSHRILHSRLQHNLIYISIFSETDIVPQQKIRLMAQQAKLHLFEQETGQRINF